MSTDTDFRSGLEAAEAAMSITAPDPALRDRYERIALVSHPRHLDQLGAPGPTTLVVSTEWLAWWVAKTQGRHATHYESRLAPCPDAIGRHQDIYLKACDWVFVNGKDATEYKGVSLGQMFANVSAAAWMTITRLEFALGQLCRDFRPSEIILFDLSSHCSILNDSAKRLLAGSVAEDHAIRFTDKFDPMLPGEPLCQTRPIFSVGRSEGGLRAGLGKIYGILIGAVSYGVWLAQGRRPKIFFFASNLTSISLMRHFRGTRVAPVFLARSFPKNLGFLWDCWRKGIVLARLPGPRRRLRGDALEKISGTFFSLWGQAKADTVDAVYRQFLRDRLFESGSLDALADQVDRFDRLLRLHRFDRVVSGDARNSIGRAICELSHAMGTPSDESQNGMFICNVKDPSHCGDGIKPPALTRQLAMGEVNVKWLDAIESPIERVITGYPALDAVKRRFPNPPSTRKRKNALVLPSHAGLTDATALRAVLDPFLINCIRVLKHHGFDAIRIKLHPEAENRHFYEQLVERFDLPADVHDGYDFLDHLEWTDLVVGPSTSGTFLETLTAGKPYYVYRPSFSGIPDSYLRSATVVSSAAELDSVLDSGTEPDIDAILEDFCATKTIANPSERMWQVLEDSVGERHPSSPTPEPAVFEAGREAVK